MNGVRWLLRYAAFQLQIATMVVNIHVSNRTDRFSPEKKECHKPFNCTRSFQTFCHCEQGSNCKYTIGMKTRKRLFVGDYSGESKQNGNREEDKIWRLIIDQEKQG